MDDWPWKYFTKEEMACKCGCGLLPLPIFMDTLDHVRATVGFPIPVTSGARCAYWNQKVAKSGPNGPHVLRLAADLGLYGEKAYHVIQAGMLWGMTGFGVYHVQRFIHVDRVSRQNPFGMVRPYVWADK